MCLIFIEKDKPIFTKTHGMHMQYHMGYTFTTKLSVELGMTFSSLNAVKGHSVLFLYWETITSFPSACSMRNTVCDYRD